MYRVSRKMMLFQKFDPENPIPNSQIQQHKNVSFVIISDKGFDGNVIVQFRPTTIELQPIEIQPPEFFTRQTNSFFLQIQKVEGKSVVNVIGPK